MQNDEQRFLSACYQDPAHIDTGVGSGLTVDHFTDSEAAAQWRILTALRAAGEATDTGAVYAHAVAAGLLDQCGGLGGITAASSQDGTAGVNGPAALSVLLAGYSRREAWKLCERGRSMAADAATSLADVGALGEALVGVCAGKVAHHRPVADIAAEAHADASAVLAGNVEVGPVIVTGLPKFDRFATPMRSHEYVVVAGRSSHGKSSLMLQIAGHNLGLGMKVVIFSLETSDKSVVKQLAGQRAGIDLRNIQDATREQQDKYMKGLEYLGKSKKLLVFDRELTVDAIAARCRLLAASFQPNLVIVDYLGLIGGTTGSAYERTSALSKAMIPIQKSLGCVLMLGVQLNQSAEKEEREPTRTDFRDSGQILEDAHRCIAVWRKPGFALDQQWFDYDLLQIKLRDGNLCKVGCRFHGPSTRFLEAHQ